jgi:formate hydrogenlyase subunit 3/multisubunit Na+/H+ antiporter MnhD subunit
MSLIVFVVVTFGFACLAIALRARRRWGIWTGLVGLAAAVVAALAIDPAQTLVIAGSGLATSAYLRLFLILASVVGLGLMVAGRAAGTRRDAPAVTLTILGSAALTMALVDPRLAVLAATTGGLFGVLITLIPGDGRAGATVGILETRAVVVAGALAIAATAWLGRDLSQLEAQPVVFGLAYLAFALAVAMRFGAIPFHLWAARLTDVVPETALPVLTAIAPASLAVVALAWIGSSVAPLAVDLTPERYVVLAIAVSTIVLAAVAAFVQDDLEHVLGYSIVGDAGVIVLALAVVGPEALAPGRTWILVFIVARGAFAVWTAGIRTGFFTGRVADLRGWARRSPMLAVALVLVAVASVGFPGLASFDARAALVDMAVVSPISTVLGIVVLVPLIYYGRLLVIGLSTPDRVGEPVMPWRPRVARPDLTAIRHWLRGTWDGNRAFTTAALAAMLAVLALATAAGAFGGPTAAAESVPTVAIPDEFGLPVPTNALPPARASASPSTVPIP